MRIYFSRHGESEANLLHEHANRGFKYGLTEAGRAQAAALAARLEDVPLARIYSSPLKRAVETARLEPRQVALGRAQVELTGVVNRSLKTDLGLRELQGEFKFSAAGDDLVSGSCFPC